MSSRQLVRCVLRAINTFTICQNMLLLTNQRNVAEVSPSLLVKLHVGTIIWFLVSWQYV